MSAEETRQRIDKWLWAARFYKTRSLAAKAVSGGHVEVDGNRVRPARAVSVGQRITLTLGYDTWDITIRALGARRGPATEAQTLYEETTESRDRRAARIAERRRQREERQLDPGRPSSRDRRQMAKLKRDPY